MIRFLYSMAMQTKNSYIRGYQHFPTVRLRQRYVHLNGFRARRLILLKDMYARP